MGKIKQKNRIDICHDSRGYYIKSPDGKIRRCNSYDEAYKLCENCKVYLKQSKSEKKKVLIDSKIELESKLHEHSSKIRDYILNSNNTPLLFHGSDGGVKGNIKCNVNSSDLCDFGQGFYTGTDLQQAENRVANKKDGIIYAYTYDLSHVRVYNFSDSVLWALFIGYSRQKGFNISNYPKLKRQIDEILSYDVIIGYIADDKISNAYDSFLNGSLTDRGLAECLKLIKYGKQIVLKNNDNVNKCLKEYARYKMSKTMRENSVTWNRELRKNMDSDIENIRLSHQRIGLYINECLEAYR